MPPPVRRMPGGRWHMTARSPHLRSRSRDAQRDRSLRVASCGEYGADQVRLSLCFATLDRGGEQRFGCAVEDCRERSSVVRKCVWVRPVFPAHGERLRHVEP